MGGPILPSYWASFRAAKIDAAISRRQMAGAFSARASVALQQRCSLPMTARSRAYDAAPRWPKRLPALLKRPSRPNPSRQRNPSDSAYRLFDVYFERRESMVPTLRGDVEAVRENVGGWRAGCNAKMSRARHGLERNAGKAGRAAVGSATRVGRAARPWVMPRSERRLTYCALYALHFLINRVDLTLQRSHGML
jgi:hypothetical protein